MCKQRLSLRCRCPWKHQPCVLVKSTQRHETAPLNDRDPCALNAPLRYQLPRGAELSALGSWSMQRHCACRRDSTCPEPTPPWRLCTCLRRRPVARPLVMLSSQTHTTALVPEVMMVVGDGHTAHRQRPQAAKFSNVTKICGRGGKGDEHWRQGPHG